MASPPTDGGTLRSSNVKLEIARPGPPDMSYRGQRISSSELDEIVRTKTVTRRVQPGGPKKKKKKKRKGVRPDTPRVSVRATKDEV